jgi:hypothetical protein
VLGEPTLEPALGATELGEPALNFPESAACPMKKIITTRTIIGKRTRIQDKAVKPLWHRTFSKKVQRSTNSALTNKVLAELCRAVARNEIALRTKYTRAGVQSSIYLYIRFILRII